MNKMLEDRAGKLLMLLIFGYMLLQQVQHLVAVVQHRDVLALWQLLLISKVTGLIFLLLIVYFTATRLPPRNSANGIIPRMMVSPTQRDLSIELFGTSVSKEINDSFVADTTPTALASLAERLPSLRRRIVVYLGARARRIGDVEVLPLRQFVGELG